MIPMSWHFLFTAAIFLGKAALMVGLVGLLIFGYVSQTQNRVAKYKKTGAHLGLAEDLFKILENCLRTTLFYAPRALRPVESLVRAVLPSIWK